MALLVAIVAFGCEGKKGTEGQNAPTSGSIVGSALTSAGAAISGASIQTSPASTTATSAADGTFTLSNVTIGSYSVTATKSGYSPYTLANVGVVAGGTTNVSLVLQLAGNTPGTVSGKVTDATTAATGIAGSVVSIQGTSLTTTTGTDGSFTLSNVTPGLLYLSATAPSAAYLDGENREAVDLSSGGTLAGVNIVLSARPTDGATEVGMAICTSCHNGGAGGSQVSQVQGAAHNRSLTRIARTPLVTGKADAGAWTRLLNPTLTTSRTVMVPLTGTIAWTVGSTAVTGTSTLFQSGGSSNALQSGDKLGYTPTGLGFTVIGTIATVNSDTSLTLTATATIATGTTNTSPTGQKYSVARLSKGPFTHMWPEDSTDIVAPAQPGVKATNPNYDANDPCIYGSLTTGTCAAGGTTQYADGQVNVYLCNLKNSTVQGVTYTSDEYVQKFGGTPYSCSDGTFWDGTTTPAVPMVHIDVIYGGQGDKDGTGASHPNMGVFKQRYQGRMADVKAVSLSTWGPAYASTADRDRDSLTLPIQVLESGDKVNGGFKMNGYHPTEQKFPGESWTQRTRTFSHACAGCHNVGMTIAWTMMNNVAIPFARDDGATALNIAAITTYNFTDENITCEQCHGPGSEHVAASGGKGHSIINPKYLTAENERQLCGKCHAYDDGVNKSPDQTYGFEFLWNDANASKLGGGAFVAGVYQLSDFLANWDERLTDEEALWNPAATNGKLYGQAHRQQYTMLSYSKHTDNIYQKVTCGSCHNSHTTYLGTPAAKADSGDVYSFTNADFRNNVACLSCHATTYGPFSAISKDDVAALHIDAGGTATKNGTAIAPTQEEKDTAKAIIAETVGKHMADKAGMDNVIYNPTDSTTPVGRCSSCHMPKVAKSGGYTTGADLWGNEALLEGDQASHVFDIIWPNEITARSVGGPTPSSAAYGTKVIVNSDNTTTTYNKFGYMPNSCSTCHVSARKASDFCTSLTDRSTCIVHP